MQTALGPVSALKMVAMLGRADFAKKAGAKVAAASTESGRVSRGRFFKGMGGAALAATVLPSSGVFATSAQAAESDGQGRHVLARAPRQVSQLLLQLRTDIAQPAGIELGAVMSDRIAGQNRPIDRVADQDVQRIAGLAGDWRPRQDQSH